MKLPHTKDKEWKEKRKILWEERYYREYEEVNEKEVAEHKRFFFDGDILKYLSSVDLIRYSEVLYNFPAETLEQFQWMTKEYWSYAHSSSDNRYIKYHESIIDMRFFEDLWSRTLNGSPYHSTELLGDIFHWAFGDKFDGERTLDIGLAEWKPTTTPDAYKMFSLMKRGLSNYLFEKELDERVSHYGSLVDYFISVLPFIKTELFNLSLPTKVANDREKRRLKSRQQTLRELFLKILGYCRVHNDKEAEQKIRKALETLPMPDAYYPFADFIHEYKRKAITKSVE